MDERIPPCRGSLGEAAGRDITEAYPAAGRGCTRQPDADTNGRNLRFVLVAGPGLTCEMARDLARRLPEDLGRRIARGIRWQADTVTAPLVADEQVDVAHVAEIVGTRLKDGDTRRLPHRPAEPDGAQPGQHRGRT
ncbi:hypothetical protein GCM10010317_103350 [Streptomyces mirabilis]|nr:hypothetical protein GCM10010317_103350 [Streptomyces mirabilis]